MTEGVHQIQPHMRQLAAPAPLRRLQGWLCWRYEQFPGEAKPRKLPYYASGQKRFGQNGSPQDKARLVTFEAAREAAARKGYDGVGFAPLPEFGVVALDFDRCVDAEGQLPREIADIVGDSYAEYSPSGNGIRAFFRGDVGNHKSPRTPSEAWAVETFSSAGYVTFTGNALASTEALGLEDVVAPAGDKVRRLCERRFGPVRERSGSADPLDLIEPPLGLSVSDMEALLSDLDPSMGRDPWIRVGMALHHETSGDDTGFALWDEWSSEGAQYPGAEALQAQWDSFERSEVGKHPVTMATVKRMSAEARAEQGLEPRVSEALQQAVESARQELDSGATPVGVATPDGFEGKFPIISAGSFSLRPPPEWLVKGVIPDADIGVIFGASGSGKSFITLDLAMSIARGLDWRGRRVKGGRVLMVVAEGGGGYASRLKAYGQHHRLDLSEVPLGIMQAVPNVLNEDDIAELLHALSKAGGFDLIVLDTFAQVTPGANENSGEDMGKALRHCRMIREVTGATVLLVHHSGKDATRGARGWSGIKAAADFELEVIRPDEGDARLLRTSKQKDGRDDLRWGFALEEVVLGIDGDGDEISSVVAVECDAPDWEPGAPVQQEPQTMTDDTLEKVIADLAFGSDSCPCPTLSAVVQAVEDRDLLLFVEGQLGGALGLLA